MIHPRSDIWYIRWSLFIDLYSVPSSRGSHRKEIIPIIKTLFHLKEGFYFFRIFLLVITEINTVIFLQQIKMYLFTSWNIDKNSQC